MSDFQRHPRTGAPYVNSLHRVTQRGYPAREPYGRPSSFGHQIEDAVGLKMWSERMVLLGATRIANLADAANLDPDDETDRVTLDSFVTSAKDAAGAFLAARRGTAVHEITAEIDRAEPSALTLIAAEEFGITAAAADALVAAWDRMRTRAALEVLAVEATVVDDRWRLAGTLDRIVRLGRDLHFGRVTVPAGTVCILDVKTGQLRLNGDGLPRYWHTYCIQIASYAGSVPYVVDEVPWLEHRDVWPFEVSARHGLLLHLDVAGALQNGEAVAHLFYVDVAQGRAAGNLARSARGWQRRGDLFHPSLDGPLTVAVATNGRATS